MGRQLLKRAGGESADPQRYRAALRSAQWSAYFNRFYGGVWEGTQIPGSLVPLSYPEATSVLRPVVDHRLRTSGARDALGRTVAQMLLAGYGPSGDRDRGFETVVCRAADIKLPTQDERRQEVDRKVSEAIQVLLQSVQLEFPKEAAFRRQVFSLRDEIDLQERSAEEPVPVPCEIIHRGDAFTVHKTVYFRQTPTSRLHSLVNPINWICLGEFFIVTDQDGSTRSRSRKRADEGDPLARPEVIVNTRSWSGVLHEKFAVDWNRCTTQTYDQLLKVEYISTPNLTRADYSLMYEKDDQIALNEGYFELRRESDFEGWMSVTMVKTVKFASILTNLMAPAILAMFLDSKAGGFSTFTVRRMPRGQRKS